MERLLELNYGKQRKSNHREQKEIVVYWILLQLDIRSKISQNMINIFQQQMANYTQKKRIVIAGSGSGKIKMPVDRIMNLVKKGMEHNTILMVLSLRRWLRNSSPVSLTAPRGCH